MGIPHTYRDKHGTYYARYVIPSSVKKYLRTGKRDIRKSLRTKATSTARIRSRIFMSGLDRLLEEFALGSYRDAEYYMGLITAFDPFGNQVSIERDNHEEEAAILLKLQEEWAGSPQLQEKLEAQKAALCADRLLHERERQHEKHSVGEVIDVFLRDKRAGLSEQPLAELRSGLELFRHFMGDDSFNSLTKAKLREFREMVPKLPARISVNKKLRMLPLQEVLEHSAKHNMPLLSARTVGKKVEAVKQLVKWAYESSDFLDEDISGVLSKKYVNVRQNKATSEYIAFQPIHLNNLVVSYVYAGAIPKRVKSITPAKFWVPMIALFSGARLEEICQLHLQDIVVEDGVQLFRITPDDDEGMGKTVHIKTNASKRRVPIHPELIRMGLDDYINELKSRGEVRLFPDLNSKNAKGKFGFSISKWFGDTLRKDIGYEKGSGYCFHSFRKNFTQRLQNTPGIEREVRKALVGHALGGGDVHEIYEGDYDAHILQAALEQLHYPDLDLSHISWEDFSERVRHWNAGR